MITLEEALQLLIEDGKSPDQAQGLIMTLTTRPDGQIDLKELQQFITRTIVEGTEPGGADGTVTPAGQPFRTEPAKLEQERLRVAMAKSLDPRQPELTPEEQRLIDEAPLDEFTNAQQFVADLLGAGEEFSYDWVYTMLVPGSLDGNEALLELYTSMTNLGALPKDEEKTDDEKILSVKEMLTRGRGTNPMVEYSVKDWGEAAGVYIPTMKDDDIDRTDIFAIMDSNGLEYLDAKTIGRVALHYDLAPRSFAEIWDNYGFKDGQVVQADDPLDIRDQTRDFKTVQRGLGDVAELYKEGLGIYDQSELLAGIHISDPVLAAKLRSDPYSLDSGELSRALDFVGGLGGLEGNPQADWIRERLAGGYKASATVDKESMRNAVQTLADGWNLTGTEAVAAALTQELVAGAVARAQASLPNPFGPLDRGVTVTDTIQDQVASVKARLRETPEYAELFEHLAGGEAEEEFVGRFERRAQSVLGDDDVSAVRNAMRAGDPNAIFQQGLLTEAGEASTRFQEIMSRNSQVFRNVL